MVKNQCSYRLCALCNMLHRSLEVILSSSLVSNQLKDGSMADNPGLFYWLLCR
ncbi:hypothetical protein HanXRQr2_Chr05g0237231 [Helianthus annuus]|uniref:Uncharacterized protein n=1 Tax=Helianthus annuus TaxID=4232 RepID=A0A251UWY0_HELAN|nr:hypothetical protein HanXRQr2_Chr05g0237231 [Helianthus annuus]KAJ0924489.1 hypothetical protein HanPSC8_Chr05g0228751 [Helianthus annuus]